MDFLILKNFLDSKVERYNHPSFIPNDPISIPHQYTKKQDIEIAAFFAAILAWGQRKTIINKCKDLLLRMDNVPHDFIIHHQDSDLQTLLGFKHRTFNDTDLLYFIQFLKHHYQRCDSLEMAFLPHNSHKTDDLSTENSLNYFRKYFFSLPDFPPRTIKHVSSPLQKSTCKRLNMFLRWMVRRDNCGVDFGIWHIIKPKHLICPCDVHVMRQARKFNLITRKQTDWKTALELTENLRNFDAEDPVKYDFALFGIGVEEKLNSKLW